MKINEYGNILIIDNNKREIEKLVDDLNKNGIATVIIKDALPQNVKINKSTNIVILDLFLDGEIDHYKAIYNIQHLSGKLKTPYFVLVWSKNPISPFIKDCEEILFKNKDLKHNNFPVLIKEIDTKRFPKSAAINSSELLQYVDQILQQEMMKNHLSILDFIAMNRNHVSKIWKFIIHNIDEYEDLFDRNTKLNALSGALLTSLDIAYGHSNSGKGLLQLNNSLIQEELEDNPLSYDVSSLDKKLKPKTNNLLLTSKLKDSTTKFNKPGMIIKDIEEMEYHTNLKDNFDNDTKPMFTSTDDINYEFKSNITFDIQKKFLIITTDCDLANKKHYTNALLEVFILTIKSLGTEKNNKKFFNIMKNTFEMELFDSDTYLLYIPRNLLTIPKNREIRKEQIENYYFNKEFVDKIRQKVGNNFSRIGVSTI